MAEKSGYGKRPMWQWILLYIIIGGIVYYLVYALFLGNKGGYTVPSGSSSKSAPAY